MRFCADFTCGLAERCRRRSASWLDHVLTLSAKSRRWPRAASWYFLRLFQRLKSGGQVRHLLAARMIRKAGTVEQPKPRFPLTLPACENGRPPVLRPLLIRKRQPQQLPLGPGRADERQAHR